jgi:hypothetical protein
MQARVAWSRMRAKIEFYPYPPPVTGYTNPPLIACQLDGVYDGLRATSGVPSGRRSSGRRAASASPNLA